MVNEYEVMVGKVMSSVVNKDDDELIFTSECGRRFTFLHYQDCCESVYIEDVCGDLEDLVGSPIVTAEEVSNEDAPKMFDEESYTWTFYKFATAKGSVTVRWLGRSNGYYSEGVSFVDEPAPTVREPVASVS